MIQTALLLLPEIMLIALGFGLRRFAGWSAEFWDGLEKLVYFVLFPALLFVSILRAPLALKQAGPAVLIALVSLVLAMVIAWLARPLLRPNHRLWASGFQCAFRFNSFIAFALIQRLSGDAGSALMALIIGAAVPLANLASVIALANQAGVVWQRELLRNPLVLATAAGLLGNLLGAGLPEPVGVTLTRLGSAALALGLLTVGVGLAAGGALLRDNANSTMANPPNHSRALPLAVWLTTTKLLLLPAIAWVSLTNFGITGVSRTVVVMFCAMPTSSTAAILASRMGGDGPFVARLITVSTVASLLTLPFWLAVVTQPSLR